MAEGVINTFLDGRITVCIGDITKQTVGAIVNAANSSLMGGAGVDGAIHRAGGGQILEECREIRRALYPQGLPPGEAVMTAGGRLPARYVIHAVGPIWGRHAGDEARLLTACYSNSLRLAAEHAIVFPAISTGAYGYPREAAARVASRAIANFLAHHESPKEVRLVFFSEDDGEVFCQNHELTRFDGLPASQVSRQKAS